MSYKLQKPYTEKQRLDFIVEYNHNQGLKIEETSKALYALEPNEIMVDGEPIIDPDYEAKFEQAEQDRINNLTMTALDFINVLKQTGLTAQEIKDYLDANIELDQQLKYCQNVYCGVVRQLLPLIVGEITITDEMIIKAFRVKNGEEIVEKEPVEEEIEDEEDNLEEGQIEKEPQDIEQLEDEGKEDD